MEYGLSKRLAVGNSVQRVIFQYNSADTCSGFSLHYLWSDMDHIVVDLSVVHSTSFTQRRRTSEGNTMPIVSQPGTLPSSLRSSGTYTT